MITTTGKFVDIEGYLNRGLTGTLISNKNIKVEIDHQHKFFEVTEKYTIQVHLKYLKPEYLSKFYIGKEEQYIAGFVRIFELDMFQAMLVYDLHDEHTFTFEFKLNDNVIVKQVKCTLKATIL
ncbi:MAG: hypothetical protein EOO20_19820 [Chryseobacterium sp.]|nr:MAG: hypothetical protein EOO20_19820 [Chryseobacterium sp.]